MPGMHYGGAPMPAPGMHMMPPGVPMPGMAPGYYPAPGHGGMAPAHGVPHGVPHGGSHGGAHGGGHGMPGQMPHKLMNPGCHKCHGSGWNGSKNKACKKCVCEKCGGSGWNAKKNKACKKMKIKRKISIADAEDDPSDHEDSLQPHGAACAGFAQEAAHRPHAAPRDPEGAARPRQAPAVPHHALPPRSGEKMRLSLRGIYGRGFQAGDGMTPRAFRKIQFQHR